LQAGVNRGFAAWADASILSAIAAVACALRMSTSGVSDPLRVPRVSCAAANSALP
jgi:hypothetical protein